MIKSHKNILSGLALLLWLFLSQCVWAQTNLINTGTTQFKIVGSTTNLKIYGNIWSENSSAYGNENSVYITGDINNNALFTNSTSSDVILSGNAAQQINSTSTLIFDNLTLDNTSVLTDGIKVNDNIEITSQFELLNGIVYSDETQIDRITALASSTVTGASSTTFVDGWMTKNGGTNAYTFPIGDNNGGSRYGYLAIDNGTTVNIAAKYNHTMYSGSATTTLAVALSAIEYWDVDLSADLTTTTITLPLDVIYNSSTAHIYGLDQSTNTWVDLGGIVNGASDAITSSVIITSNIVALTIGNVVDCPMVTTNEDNGDNINPTPGSLREAIICANQNPDHSSIYFNIDPLAPNILVNPDQIQLIGTDDLPDIIYPVTIVGQNNFAGTSFNVTVIASSSSTNSSGFTFIPGSENSVISDINMEGFSFAGIQSENAGLVINNCDINGQDLAGSAGVRFYNNASNSQLTNSKLYSNQTGVNIYDASSNIELYGNYIGTQDGITAFPNTFRGVLVRHTASNIAVQRNVISGNDGYGIEVLTEGELLIDGNIIGLTADQSAKLSNVRHGIDIDGDGTFTSTSNRTITNNIIAGNSDMGIYALQTNNLLIDNNTIGVNSSLQPLGNKSNGISVTQSMDVTITNNRVSANGDGNVNAVHDGIHLYRTSKVSITNNVVGGSSALGNGSHGISVRGNSELQDVAGYFLTISGNTTSYNGTHGINLADVDYAIPAIAEVINNNTQFNDVTGVAIAGSENILVDSNISLNNLASGLRGHNAESLTITNNTFNGNGTTGITFLGTSNSTIQGNTIGEAMAGNGTIGMYLTSRINVGISYNSNNNIISENNIEHNGNDGIRMYGLQSLETNSNQIIDNTIHNNGGDGIEIDESNGQNVDFNFIECNSFFNNTNLAINIQGTGTPNENVQPPVITYVNTTNGQITGTSAPNESIQIYRLASGGGNQDAIECLSHGNLYAADANGDWVIPAGTLPLAGSNLATIADGDLLVATATTANNSTSELSTIITAGPCPMVTTNEDNGDNINPTPGSLREAIICANGTPGYQIITFDFSSLPSPGTSICGEPLPYTINLTDELPTITDYALIDGSTANAPIILEGLGINTVNKQGLVFNISTPSAGTSIVSGVNNLWIQNFSSYGIQVASDYVHIDNCVVSNNCLNNTHSQSYLAQIYFVTADNGQVTNCEVGALKTPGTQNTICYTYTENSAPANGIFLNQANNTLIQANLVGGNNGDGIRVLNSQLVNIEKNEVGRTITFDQFVNSYTLPNNNGISVAGNARLVTIGGSNTLDGNFIAGNRNSGIYANGNSEIDIENNIIGLRVNTSSMLNIYEELPNIQRGIHIFSNPGIPNTVTKNIINNTIAGSGSDGIFINYSQIVNIYGNKVGVYDNSGTIAQMGNGGYGIITSHSSNFKIGGTQTGQSNIISGNGSNGLYIFSCDDFSVESNIIGHDGQGNTIPNTGHGAYINGANGVNQNIFTNNNSSGNFKSGLALNNVSNLLIDDNVFGADNSLMIPIPNGTQGINVSSINSAGIISNNKVLNNASYGMFLRNMNDVIVENNTISGNVSIGIFCQLIENTIIQKNTVTQNGYGINLSLSNVNFSPSENVFVKENTIDNNSGYGIYSNKSVFTGGVNLIISDNSIQNNGNHGIVMNNSEGIIIDNNDIMSNATYGVYAQISNNIDIENNVISGNKGVAGVYLYGTNNSIISANYIGTDRMHTLSMPNLGYGVIIGRYNASLGASGASNNTIIDNYIYYNGNHAIQITDAAITFPVDFNYIQCNHFNFLGTKNAINLSYADVNEGVQPPVIMYADGTSGTISGETNPTEIGQTIQVYILAAGGTDQEAETCITDNLNPIITDNNGNWTVSGLNFNNGDRLVATATTPNKSTSELSAAIEAAACPTIVIGNLQDFCENFTGDHIFTYNASNIISYDWKLTDPNNNETSFTSNTSDFEVEFDQLTDPGVYTIALTVTSTFGCTVIGTNQFTIHPLPDVSFNLTPQICSGEQISIAPTNTVAGATYSWEITQSGIPLQGSPFVQNPLISSSLINLNKSGQDLVYEVVLVATVTNVNCTETSLPQSITVHPHIELVLDDPLVQGGEGCLELNNRSSDGFVNFQIVGGKMDYNFSPTNNLQSPSLPSSTREPYELIELTTNDFGFNPFAFTLNNPKTYTYTVTDGINLSNAKQCTTSIDHDVTYDGIVVSPCVRYGRCTPVGDAMDLGEIEFTIGINQMSRFATDLFAYKFTDQYGTVLDEITLADNQQIINATNKFVISNLPIGAYKLVVEHYRDQNESGNTDQNFELYCSQTLDLDVKQPVVRLGNKSKYYFCQDFKNDMDITFNPSISTGAFGCSYGLGEEYRLEITGINGGATTIINSPALFEATLAPGAYSYILTENNHGCTVTGTFEVIKQEIEINVITQDVKCNGGTDGEATAILSNYGGSGEIYTWGPSFQAHDGSGFIEGLPQGVGYTVSVITVEGCTTDPKLFNINEPNPLAFTIVNTPQTGDCIITGEVDITGGTAGYTVSAIKIQDENGNPINENTIGSASVASNGDFSIDELTAGFYKLLLVDANGCQLYYDGPIAITAPIRAARKYNICVTWHTTPEEIEEPAPPANVTITTSELANSILNEAEKCLGDAEFEGFDKLNETCYNIDSINDGLTLTYPQNYNHYTLYYYDRAGDLVATVPPSGVDALFASGNPVPSNKLDPDYTSTYEYENDVTDQGFKTYYAYNTLGQLEYQRTPDGANTHFKYNDIGQLRFSQNAEQASSLNVDGTVKPEEYSYTLYDELGRITEVGQAEGNFDGLDVELMLAQGTSTSERTTTFYTVTNPDGADYFGKPQRNLRNRVSYTIAENLNTDVSTTYYSYDPHGNVEWLIQDVPGLGKNYVGYEYDLISGNVKQVSYNEGLPDQFYHKYAYDESNRITDAYTSRNGIIWDKDANYRYMPHGPLARVTLGEDNLQGIDYAYTIQGWLKGINSAQANSNDNAIVEDVGSKGENYNNDDNTAGDLFSMSLSYFNNDFDNLSFNSSFTNEVENSDELFNGNISAWTSSIIDPTAGTWEDGRGKAGYTYQYDRLNRLRNAKSHDWTPSLPTFTEGNFIANVNNDYQVDLEYDRNGNIQTLDRNAFSGPTEVDNPNYDSNDPLSPAKIIITHDNSMDNMSYNYIGESNQLDYVTDGAYTGVSTGTGDNDPLLGWDDIKEGQVTGNYKYDAIGNLVEDVAENKKITWNVYGKVASVEPLTGAIDNGENKKLVFTYDAAGNRVKKDVFGTEQEERKTTYYVRDASGNVMSIYDRSSYEVSGGNLNDYELKMEQKEVPIYGSDRLGLNKSNIVLASVAYNTQTDNIDVLSLNRNTSTVTHKSTLDYWVFATEGASTPDNIYINPAGDFDLNNPLPITGLSTFGNYTVSDNVIGLAENNGDVQFAFFEIDDNTLVIIDKLGVVLNNAQQLNINVANESKPVAFKRPGYSNQYIVMYQEELTANYKYLIVDMNTYQITSINNTITSEMGNNIGTSIAVIENTITDEVRLFYTIQEEAIDNRMLKQMSWNANNKTSIVLEDLGLNYIGSGNAELAIHPNGEEVAVGIKTSSNGNQIMLYNLTTATASVPLPSGLLLGTGKLKLTYNADGSNIVYTVDEIWGNTVVGCNIGEPTYTKGDVRTTTTDVIAFGKTNVDSKVFNCATTALNLSSRPRYGLPYQNHKVLLINYNVKEQLIAREVGEKQYEMKDHLGNVRMVISDKQVINLGIKDANVISYNNYYPFGMIQPGRNYSSNGYRYGFNGKEKDDELKGSGNSYDFGARMYDPRLGKWLSTDALEHQYPSQSPYCYAINNPIFFIDPDGNEVKPGKLNAAQLTVFNSAIKLTSFQRVFKGLIESTNQHAVLGSKVLYIGDEGATYGKTSYTHIRYGYEQESTNSIFNRVNLLMDKGVEEARANISLSKNIGGTGISGLAAAGTMFHELWHVKIAQEQEKGGGDQHVQHKDMSDDLDYIKEKINFLTEFKGNELTDAEKSFHTWSGLSSTDTFKKTMFTNGENNEGGFTEEGTKYFSNIKKVNQVTGVEETK